MSELTIEPAIQNPARCAHASIGGYLYQVCLGVERWLQLEDDEVLLLEGDEDLDRLVCGPGGEELLRSVEQVKLREQLRLEDLRASLVNFITGFVEQRRQGRQRVHLFSCNAEVPRGGRDPLWNAVRTWSDEAHRPTVVAAVRAVAEEHCPEDAAFLGEGDGWNDFVESVQWCMGQGGIDEVMRRVHHLLESREDCTGDVALLADRLVMNLLRGSSEAEVVLRTRTRGDLQAVLTATAQEIAEWSRSPRLRRLRTAMEELEALRQVLHPGSRELPEDPQPSTLLQPAFEVVPFHEKGRVDILEELFEWCSGEEQAGVWLLHGSGGVGKTRLLIELGHRLRESGWHAGFLQSHETGSRLDPVFTGQTPRLVVVDYAETRTDLVWDLLNRLADAPEGIPKIRFVLLTRAVGEWWKKIGERSSGIGTLLHSSGRVQRLESLEALPEDRGLVFDQAVASFGASSIAGKGDDRPLAACAPDLGGEPFDRVLYVHAAALSQVLEPCTSPADDPLAEVLRHEQRFWWKQALALANHSQDDAEDYQKVLAAAVTIITLMGGAGDTKAAMAVLRRACEIEDVHGLKLSTLCRVLRRLYPGPDRPGAPWIAALEPELLGEELVAANATEDLLVAVLADGAAEFVVATALTVLDRLAARRGEWFGRLERVLGRDLPRLIEPAMAVALKTGWPMGVVLASAFEAEGDVELARQINPQLPPNTLELREIATVSQRRLYSDHRENHNPESEPDLALLADLANTLGYRLSAIGRREEALAATEEAVNIRRKLVRIHPGSYEPDLADSLNILGNRYNALGCREKALAATEEAVELFRGLSSQRQGAFRRKLAMALSSLGICRKALGQREEALTVAEEAVELFRRIERQGRGELAPDLAHSLINLGHVYAANGRRWEALEATKSAVDLYRNLASSRPDEFLPDLALSLCNLGTMLSDLGRHEQAYEASGSAAGLFRRLARSRPEVFDPDYARSLNNLGNRLRAIGRSKDALAVTSMAVDIYRRLASNRPDVFDPDLAKSLNNLGNRYSAIGRLKEAMDASAEAVAIRRRLARRLPKTFEPDLVVSLGNLGLMYRDAGQIKEALDATEEATRKILPFLRRLPRAFEDLARQIVGDYRRHAAQAGRDPDRDLLNEIETILATLDAPESDTADPD